MSDTCHELRRIALMIILLAAGLPAFAQAQAGRAAGVSVSLSDNSLIHASRVLGAGSVDDRHTTRFGLYYRNLGPRGLGWETGLQYLKHSFSMTPAFTGSPLPSSRQAFQLLSMPVYARLTFLKYFYVNGGLLLDVDVKNSGGVNNQSGAGLGLGGGVSWFFSGRAGVFLNPQIAQHSLLSFSGERNPRRLAESSITLGIACRLD